MKNTNKVLLIHKRTKEVIECCLTEAARRLKKTPKTLGVWRKKSEHSIPKYFKEYDRYEIYFNKSVIKQDKAKNLP